MHGNILLGKAGELRVASELMKRGTEVFLSIADDGTDLILSSGVRIQVKSSRKSRHKKREASSKYIYTFRHWSSEKGKRRAANLSNVDIVILWAVDPKDDCNVTPR